MAIGRVSITARPAASKELTTGVAKPISATTIVSLAGWQDAATGMAPIGSYA